MTLIIQKPSMMEIIRTIEVLRRRRRRRRILLTVLAVLLVLCVGAFVAAKTVAVPVRNTGVNMTETLADGDLALVNIMNYEPARGDVVVCRLRDGSNLFGRVIGIAGDTVSVNPVEGTVSVNGQELQEDYVKLLSPGNLIDQTVTVKEGYVYLMGDNRVEATDSRTIGTVLVSQLKGRVWFVLSPRMRRIQ